MSKNEIEPLRAKILTLTKDYSELLIAKHEFSPGNDPVSVSGKVLGSEDFVNLVDSSLDGWFK